TNPPSQESRGRLIYWIFGIVGIAISLEIIYWTFRCINLVKKKDDGNNNDVAINRRRGLFDTPSYAGSIDEQLPPYESFSLPKYNNIVNESTPESIQVVEVDTGISDTNTSQPNVSPSSPTQPPQPPQPQPTPECHSLS